MNERALRHTVRFAGKATALAAIPTAIALSASNPNWQLLGVLVAGLLVAYALFDEVDRVVQTAT